MSHEAEPQPESPRPSRFQTVLNEVREHPMAAIVLVAFVIAGPVATTQLFPEAPLGVGIVGGVFLGVFAALCAVPGEFF